MSQPQAPPGVCRYFYTRGHCSKFDCKFSHPDSSDFLSDPSLSRGSGHRHGGNNETASVVASTTMSPSDALKHLARFCAPRVQLDKPLKIKNFVDLLANVGSKDISWVSLSVGIWYFWRLNVTIGPRRRAQVLGFDHQCEFPFERPMKRLTKSTLP